MRELSFKMDANKQRDKFDSFLMIWKTFMLLFLIIGVYQIFTLDICQGLCVCPEISLFKLIKDLWGLWVFGFMFVMSMPRCKG